MNFIANKQHQIQEYPKKVQSFKSHCRVIKFEKKKENLKIYVT